MAYSFDVLTFFVPPVTRVMSLSNPKFLRLSDFDQLEGTGVTAWTWQTDRRVQRFMRFQRGPHNNTVGVEHYIGW